MNFMGRFSNGKKIKERYIPSKSCGSDIRIRIFDHNFIIAGHSACGGLTAAVTLKARDTGNADIPNARRPSKHPISNGNGGEWDGWSEHSFTYPYLCHFALKNGYFFSFFFKNFNMK